MIVNNGQNIIFTKCMYAPPNSQGYLPLVTTGGDSKLAYSTYIDAMYHYKTDWGDPTQSGVYILVGVGTVPVSESQIDLSNKMIGTADINTLLKLTAMTALVSDVGECVYVGLLTNLTDQDILFREVGLFVTINGATAEYTGDFLVTRDVTRQERIVKAHESTCICIKINFQHREESVL